MEAPPSLAFGPEIGHDDDDDVFYLSARNKK
jgi:hypothetical protein